MMMLQSQVTLLDRFVIQQESIPNLLPPLGARHVPMQYVNRGADGTANLGKNVCINQRLPPITAHLSIVSNNGKWFFY